MIKKTNAILVVLLTIFTQSCSDDDEQPSISIGISQEIKDLIYFNGDEASDTVLIIVQAGPDTVLLTNEIDQFLQSFNSTNFLTVNVHQAQTLNPNLFTGNDITFDQAINFNVESIEALSTVVKFFKDQGRTVYVFGNSFGAFMTQELITTKGIDIADKYLIMTGRLDMNDEVWQALSEGRFGFFENGTTPIIDDEEDPDVTNRNLGKLAAAVAMNRYTQLLDNIQDLSKITYVYGQTDEAVGSLADTELQFLQSKNVNIIVGNGGHDETFDEFFLQGFSEAFGIE